MESNIIKEVAELDKFKQPRIGQWVKTKIYNSKPLELIKDLVRKHSNREIWF
jgi:hypothetical protein